MGDKLSTLQSPGEDPPPSPPPPTTTLWQRFSRRLFPVEVAVDRDNLRRPLRNEEGESPAADDPDGPTPPKRQCPPPDQDHKEEQQTDKEKAKETEKEKAEMEKDMNEKAAKEKAAKEKAEKEKAEKEKAEKEKDDKEKAEKEKADKEKADKEKADKEKAEKEMAADREKNKVDPYECPLCLESVEHRNPVSTKCGHIFCQKCLEDALGRARKCPMCNATAKRNPFIRIYM